MEPDIPIEQDVASILLPGRFDATNAPEIESRLKAVAEKSPKILIFDFSGTTYIASAGLRVLLVISRMIMKSGGKVALCSLSPGVMEVFTMAGFTRIFAIYPTKNEAISSFR